MAAPSYTEDLTDIALAPNPISTESTWAIVNFDGGGGQNIDEGPDLAMQGGWCALRQITGTTGADRGVGFENSGGGISAVNTAGVHIYQWVFVGTPGLTDNWSNYGIHLFAGTGTVNGFSGMRYAVGGVDLLGATGRVGVCYAYRYDITATTASPPYRTQVGTAPTNPDVFGGGMNTVSSARGLNLGIDAIRYGTGGYITAGELISDGDVSDNPANFLGFSTENDLIANRWGILTQSGGAFELQGKFVIGQDNTGTATTCKFQDSNSTVGFVNGYHAEFDFNEIVVDGASSICNLTNLSLNTLGDWTAGIFTVTAGTVTISGGTWTDLYLVSLGTTSTVTDTFFQRVQRINASTGSTLTGCRFIFTERAEPESGTSLGANGGLFVDAFSQVDSCTFEGSYDYGLYVNGTFGAGTTNVTFNSTLDTAATTADISVDVPTGATLNITVGAVVPTVENRAGSPGTINILQNQTQVTLISLQSNSEIRVYTRDGNGDNDVEIDGVENSGTSFAFNYTAGEFVNITIFNKAYLSIYLDNFEIPASDTNVTIQQSTDRFFAGTP